jgi:hypothetical protein
MIGSWILFAVGLVDFIFGIILISSDTGERAIAVISGREFVITLGGQVKATLAF